MSRMTDLQYIRWYYYLHINVLGQTQRSPQQSRVWLAGYQGPRGALR
jgi:hypothetical protein